MGTIKITGPDRLMYENKTYKCAIGLSGISDSKKENDGATPAGQYNIRSVLYRPDRIPPPDTFLRIEPLKIDDVWCDNPEKKEYNLKSILSINFAKPTRMKELDKVPRA